MSLRKQVSFRNLSGKVALYRQRVLPIGCLQGLPAR
jgi:hypothetical protein